MKTILMIATVTVLLSGSLFAQLPPTLPDTAIQPSDSPLVAAAKRAVAARQQSAQHASWVIDDSMVTHRLFPVDSAAPMQQASTAARAEGPATFSSYQPAVTPQQARARKSALERELARMIEESDQPYGGDAEEDLVDKRLSEIPGQLGAMNGQTPPAHQ